MRRTLERSRATQALVIVAALFAASTVAAQQWRYEIIRSGQSANLVDPASLDLSYPPRGTKPRILAPGEKNEGTVISRAEFERRSAAPQLVIFISDSSDTTTKPTPALVGRDWLESWGNAQMSGRFSPSSPGTNGGGKDRPDLIWVQP